MSGVADAAGSKPARPAAAGWSRESGVVRRHGGRGDRARCHRRCDQVPLGARVIRPTDGRIERPLYRNGDDSSKPWFMMLRRFFRERVSGSATSLTLPVRLDERTELDA
jgi:hypothetical protein